MNDGAKVRPDVCFFVLLLSILQMPTIAFGTGSKWKGHVRLLVPVKLATVVSHQIGDSQDVTSYVEQAIELGFSHLDTAQCQFITPLKISAKLTFSNRLRHRRVCRHCYPRERAFSFRSLHYHEVLWNRYSCGCYQHQSRESQRSACECIRGLC